MIQFFNPHAEKDDQMMYNGEWPYVHWAEPFSIGVIRYKSLYFISNESKVNVKIDAKRNPFTGSLINWNFALYNPDHVDAELRAIDWHYFCDLGAVATDNLTLEGQLVEIEDTDGHKQTVYAYQLIIMCRSDVEGEFIETFYINSVPYKVGAEFYGENESLKINLANQGTEIPSIVGKAIYGTDLYEENVDWVLLNRKFRELLVSHLDIMDNKGSYKSLYNALKWFEYDNLVELREVWRFNTPDGAKYYDRPIQTIVNEEVTDRMFNSAKTTYFSLRHLKRRIVGHEDKPVEFEWIGSKPSTFALKPTSPNIETENVAIYEDTTYDYDPDSNIELKGLACKWTEDEMKLKMVLLGNFFETYFMPVHTDLIRSVVEDINDFSLDMGFGAGETIHDEVVDNETFDLLWGLDEDNDQDAPIEDLFAPHIISLDEVHVYAGLPQDTPYWNAFENTNPDRDDFCPIIACHTYGKTDPIEATERQVMAAMLGQVYNGIGALETANFKAPEPIVSGKCVSNQWGDFIETSFENTTSADNSFSVTFLFPHPGNFDFYFDLVGVSGRHYTRHATITVEDNISAQIEFYKIQSKPWELFEATNPFTDPLDITPMMAIDRDRQFDVYNEQEDSYEVKSTDINPTYTQYIPIGLPYDKATPVDAPVLTKVRTIQWTGPSAYQSKARYMSTNEYKAILKNGWAEVGDNSDDKDATTKTAWIRFCSKHRGVGPAPVTMASGAYTIFDLNVFFPELHRLVKIAPRERVSAYYPIVCVPEIHIIGKEPRRIKYTLMSDTPAWEFFSYGLHETINSLDRNISTPIMARSIRQNMPRGMYQVTFNYRFGNENRKIVANPDWILENKDKEDA